MVCVQRWKCSTCGRQVRGDKPMETPPLGPSCPSCALLEVQKLESSFSTMDIKDSNASQSPMDVENSNAPLSAGRVASEASSSVWAPHRGKCYHPSGSFACTFTSSKHCAIGTMERAFRNQDVRWISRHASKLEEDIYTMLKWK